MAVAEDRFFETRAVQLAIVHLTRQPDVQVTQDSQDYGYDLLVSLLENGQNVGRLLAVQVKAVESGKRISTLRLSDGQETAYSEYRFPFCLFAFGMDNDQGFWRWIRKPDLDTAKRRSLISVKDETLDPLTKTAMNDLLESVREWYDS